MSLTITNCMHSITEIDGEKICADCAQVIGYSETQSVSDWKNHNIGLFSNSKNYVIISKVAKNLGLPQYALHTILQISSKLKQYPITTKQSILYAIVYACRLHDIPRLLEDIFSQLEKAYGKRIQKTETALLKLLHRISVKINDAKFRIPTPDKEYYLQAYLAKIQDDIASNTDDRYFEIIRTRSLKKIQQQRGDPSMAAKTVILQSTSRILESKIRRTLNC